METINHAAARHVPWNKGKLAGQKAPLKQREIWAIRIRLQLHEDARELALFDLAIDSKLRSCDLVRLRIRDVCQGGRVASRAIVMQRKTQRPVQFEITEQTRESLSSWIRSAERESDDHLFSSNFKPRPARPNCAEPSLLLCSCILELVGLNHRFVGRLLGTLGVASRGIRIALSEFPAGCGSGVFHTRFELPRSRGRADIKALGGHGVTHRNIDDRYSCVALTDHGLDRSVRFDEHFRVLRGLRERIATYDSGCHTGRTD